MSGLDKILTNLDTKYSYWAKCDTAYMQDYVAEAKQAIRQEILKAELRGFDKAFDSHDYDGLRKYRSGLQASLKDGGKTE